MSNLSYEFIKDGKGFAYDKNGNRITTSCRIKKSDGEILSIQPMHLDVLEPFIKPSINSIKHNHLEIIG